MISLFCLIGLGTAVIPHRDEVLHSLQPLPAYKRRADTVADNPVQNAQSLLESGPLINTGGAPTVSIYNGNTAPVGAAANGSATPDPRNASRNDLAADLASSVLKSAEITDKDADKARSQEEMLGIELDQKSSGMSGQIAAQTEKKASDLEESAKRDTQTVDAEEKRHANVMAAIEDEENNEETAFADEEHLERKKIHADEQNVAHDEAVVKEGQHALEDEARLEADGLVTEKSKEEQKLQSTRRKYREEDEAINLGHDETESAAMAKKLIAQRAGEKHAESEEHCAEHQAEQVAVPSPVGVAEGMPCEGTP